MAPPGDRHDWSPYAGRWVALVGSDVAGTGVTAAQARHAAKANRCREEPLVAYVGADGRLCDASPAAHEASAIRDGAPAYSATSAFPDAPPLASFLSPLAIEVLALVREREPQAHLVGGVVRDWLLGRSTHDLDLVVPQGALALAKALADRLRGAYYPVDEERDVGRVVLAGGATRLVVDIASWRGESLAADLRGRDFTVNALAIPVGGIGTEDLVDITSGFDDLRRRVIRVVSENALLDDPARLLRAVRLAGELGFEIEAETQDDIRRKAASVTAVSGERVHEELCRILALPQAASWVRRLDHLGLLSALFPELDPLRGLAQPSPHQYDAWEHTLHVLAGLDSALDSLGTAFPPGGSDADWRKAIATLAPLSAQLRSYLAEECAPGESRRVLLRMAALFHDVGKPDTRTEERGNVRFTDHPSIGAGIASAPLARLRFSRDGSDVVATLIRQHMWLLSLSRTADVSRRAVYRYHRTMGENGPLGALLFLADWMGVSEAPCAGWSQVAAVVVRVIQAWFLQPEIVAPVLLVGGDEIMSAIGLEPGPWVGRLLERIREAQADGSVTNREQALALARRICGSDRR